MMQTPAVTATSQNQRTTSNVVRNAANNNRREPTPEEIRLRAYQIYERRNREPGHELEDWAQAERELRAGR